MKKIILFISFLSSISLIDAGVSIDTIVQTVDGPRKMGFLQAGDRVACFDDQLKEDSGLVENIEFKTLNNVIEIITADDVVIRVAPEQKFFVFYKWVNAEDLSLNDFLFTENKSCIRIKSIRHLQEEETFCFIEVKDHHNFFATENGILIHNGPNGAVIGAYVGRWLAYAGWGAGAAIVSLPALAGGPLAYSLAIGATLGTSVHSIEATATVMAVAGGIIGGVITGPA